ncbi:MAG: zinc ABC transporter substrate-binding protein [Rikenellaceae bacterium]
MKYLYFTLLLSMASCAQQTVEKDNTITVSIDPLKYFVDKISGGDFEVNVLVPKGASAETYEPTPSDIKNVTKSKAFISVGLLDTEINIIEYLEKKNDILNIELYKNCELIESDGCGCGSAHHSHNETSHDEHGHSHLSQDPHIWISVKNSRQIAKDTYEALVMLNRDSLNKYNENYSNLINSLNEVDSVFSANKGIVNTVLVYHPFLGYLADEYSFTQVSIEDEGKEPSAKKIKELITDAKNEGIKTVFYQSQFPTSSVESIAKELSAKTVKIDPLEYDHIQNLINISNSLRYE